MLHNLLILFTNVLDCDFVFPKRKAWKKSSKLSKSTLADKHKLGDNEVALEASFSVSSLYVFINLPIDYSCSCFTNTAKIKKCDVISTCKGL